MGVGNLVKLTTTGWHQMTVKELLAAADIRSPGSNLEKTLIALYGSSNQNFDNTTMGNIIDEIVNIKEDEKSSTTAVANADKALVCLADTFAAVNRQVCAGNIYGKKSSCLDSFFYVISHFFCTILEKDQQNNILMFILEVREIDDRCEAARYFPIINIISALSEIAKNGLDDRREEAVGFLYIIVKDRLTINSQNKP